MIKAVSQAENYRTLFTNRKTSALADAPQEKGGAGAGFGPHELLEAALATCLNMAIRMAAAKLGIELEDVTTTVRLDRGDPDAAILEYSTEIFGKLTTSERQQLQDAARTCPVRQTLCRSMQFKELDCSRG